MADFNWRRFSIGDSVTVKYPAIPYYDQNLVRRIRNGGLWAFREPRNGLVVGATVIQLGKLIPVPGERWYLDVSECVHVWLVRFTIRGRPVKALDDDVSPADTKVILPIQESGKWTDRDREAMREEAKYFPRDTRGRFAKHESQPIKS